MVTATLSYKTTNIKFYIAEHKMPLDNQLQYKSHTVRNLFLPRPNKPEELKESLDTQKSPQPDVTVGNQQAKNNQSKNYNQYNIITLQKKQFEGHTTTKRNSRNEEYKTAKENTLKTQPTSRNDRNNN